VSPEPRKEFYQSMDAANVDLKAFTEDFYWKVTGSHLQPVLETIEYIHHETDVWMELTTLLIPGYNDSEKEIDEMSSWVIEKLGPDVPMHFTAFHPDYKLMDAPRTPLATLQRAREIARNNGVRYAYTGNVHDRLGDSTYCHSCGVRLIERDWYELGEWNLDEKGHCKRCGTPCAGVFESGHGDWGSKREPVRLANYA
jgi:pyruvate formate lyase activating enzyme